MYQWAIQDISKWCVDLPQILGSSTGMIKATWISTNLQGSIGGFGKQENRKEWETNGLWTGNFKWNKEHPLNTKK